MRRRIAACLLWGMAWTAHAEDISAARREALLNLLRQDCGSCHGMTLKGGLGPSLLPEALAGKSDEFLITTILDRHPDTAMPPWRHFLSPHEAGWLVQQLRAHSW